MLPAAHVAEAMRQITAAPNTFIVVDGNNVRGRVGFRLGKGELSALLVTWAERHQLSEQVVVAWDHGQRSEVLVWRGVCHGADALRLEHRAAVESAPSQRLTHPRLWRSLRGAPTTTCVAFRSNRVAVAQPSHATPGQRVHVLHVHERMSLCMSLCMSTRMSVCLPQAMRVLMRCQA